MKPFRILSHSSPRRRLALLAVNVLKINDPKGIDMYINFSSVAMEHLLKESKMGSSHCHSGKNDLSINR